MEPPILTLTHLSLSFPGKILFAGAQLEIHQGDRVGVLGLNGKGKSSLFKVLMREITPDTTTPAFMRDEKKGLSLFRVPQELPFQDSLNSTTVKDVFYFYYPLYRRLENEIASVEQLIGTEINENKLNSLLERQQHLYEELEHSGLEKVYLSYGSYLKRYGISEMDRTLSTFSGGFMRKIALALGLSAPHHIILWDEPTNHLDLETIWQFEEDLEKCNKTFLLITHDRELLNQVVEKVFHIEKGVLKTFKGTYQQYLEYLKNEALSQQKMLDKLDNLARRETAWIRRGAPARRTKSKDRIEDYFKLMDRIQTIKRNAPEKVSLNLSQGTSKSKLLVEFKNTTIGYHPDKPLIKNFDYNFLKGFKIGLLGPNGAGKSTLVQTILGNLKHLSGELKVREGISFGYFSQGRLEIPLHLTPLEWVGDGFDSIVLPNGKTRHIISYLQDFLFNSEEIHRPMHTFSGGEKNRLQLAKFMKTPQDFWIFDEPTNDLDLETLGILEEELKNFDGSLLLITHDRTFLQNVVDICWVLDEGKILNFTGGAGQALEYVELKQLAQSETEKQKQSTKPVSKNPNEQKRWEEKIEQLEQKIAKEREALANIDYTGDANKAAFHAKKIQKELTRLESELKIAFEQWEHASSIK